LGDQHSGAHVPASATASMQDPCSSSAVLLSESSVLVSSAAAGLSMSSTSVSSSTPVSVTLTFPESASLSASLSSKPFSASESLAAKSSAASEEATKCEGSRTTESSTKSVPTSGFVTTTDFQAKFLEFSQRKASCVPVGQTAPSDDPDATGSANSVKVKKSDVSGAPSAQKKSSPVAEESFESADMKPGECSSSSESHPEVPATSLPMQVDGCCDSCSDESSDEDITVPHSSYSVDRQYIEFMNEEEPELVEIWRSSIGLQVDGAADDETGDAEENQEKSTVNNDDETVADNQHQLTSGSETETSTAAADIGMATTVSAVEVTTPSCTSAVLDTVSHSTVVSSSTSRESMLSNEHKPVDVHTPNTAKHQHLSTDISSDVSISESVSMPSAELQPSIAEITNVPAETAVPAPVPCLQSVISRTLETGDDPVATAAVTPLVSELQSPSACDAPLAAVANASASHSEPTSQNPLFASDREVVPSRYTMNQPQSTSEDLVSSLPSAVAASVSCAMTASVTSPAVVTVQSGESSKCLTVASSLDSDCSTVNISSQVVESYSAATTAVAMDPASVLSVPGTSSAITSTAVVAMSQTSHMDSGNVAATNPAFNGAFQLRPEMQSFVGHPPRRMYLPPEFHMQHRMIQRGMPPGEGMMIPAEQLPHGPPPPYPNKQFAGPQTFWVRQQHPSSGMAPEWIRHPGDFGHRPLPPNVGSHEWSRPQMIPAEWSGRQRMQQEWVYFPQQPHQPSQAPHQWVRPPYSNMPGFQQGTADAAPMQADAYNSGYQSAPRNAPNSATVTQDVHVAAQGIKSPGTVTPRPSSHPSGSPVPVSPASARADMTSPQSRSHTPRSMSRSSTPQAPMSNTSGMSRTPDHVALPTGTAVSPHPSAAAPPAMTSTMPTSSPMEQSPLPSSNYQAADHVGMSPSETPRPAVGDVTSASVPGTVSAAEPGTNQPSLTVVSGTHADNPPMSLSATQLAAFSHASAENMIYMHRPPHGIPMSPEMRRMGPPPGGRYSAPLSQGMYMPGHAGPGTSGMTFYRMPSSAASSHSTIGALLNQQRAPVGMSVHYPSVNQAPVAPAVESRYQLIHTQDVYLPHSQQRHVYSPAVTVAGPSASGAGSFVLQHQQRAPAPPLPAEPAAHQEVPNQATVLPNNMQTLRGPFRMPQQLGPGSVPMGMRVAGSSQPMVYGPQRPVPSSQVRMIATAEMRPQMIHIPRSSVTEFPGTAYRPRPPGEQPLLLEDLLEQVCYPCLS